MNCFKTEKATVGSLKKIFLVELDTMASIAMDELKKRWTYMRNWRYKLYFSDLYTISFSVEPYACCSWHYIEDSKAQKSSFPEHPLGEFCGSNKTYLSVV